MLDRLHWKLCFCLLLAAAPRTARGDTVTFGATKFALNQVNWNGSSHQQGGVSRVGGYTRNPLTAYDYETLASFDVNGVQGEVTSARLRFYVSGGPTGGSQAVRLYEQDILPSFNPSQVSYSTFSSGPFTSLGWTNLLGQATVNGAQPGWREIHGDALRTLTQSWVDEPATNAGVVLTGTFWYYSYYAQITNVELVVDYTPDADWRVVGERDILGYRASGVPDMAVGPDAAIYIGLRDNSCSLCEPPSRPVVARYNGGAWEDLNFDPEGKSTDAFVAVGVTPNNDVLALTSDHRFRVLVGSDWTELPMYPDALNIPQPIPDFVVAPSGVVYALGFGGGANEATVARMGGPGWEILPGYSSADVDAGLAVAPDGEPAVAYVNEALAEIRVTRFDGSAFVAVAPAGIPFGGLTRIDGPDLTYAPDGTLYVAFRGANGMAELNLPNVIRVYRLEGSGWVQVGGDVIHPYPRRAQAQPSLRASSASQLYLTRGIYLGNLDLGYDVASFTGGGWQDISSAGFDDLKSVLLHAFDLLPDSTPVASYIDFETFGAVVKEFE